MRVIPVLDLKDGLAVHAIRGERDHYGPLASMLADTAEPLVLARAFREQLGLSELYVADLNAIQGDGDHQAIIADLAKQGKLALMVDAGITSADRAQELLATGANKVIIGTETLSGWEALVAICATIPARHLVFSLDMRSGRVLSHSPQLSALDPLGVLDGLQRTGLREVILLDLARVGTGGGTDQALIKEARRRYPELALLAGGGVRNMDELCRLEALGVDGVLVGTALHQGTITARDLRA